MDNTFTPLATNRTMPTCSIIPVLGYTDVEEAIDWLCEKFGFTERWRVGNHRAQLAFGDGAIALSEQHSDEPDSNISGSLIPSQSLMVRVQDVNQHYEHAKQLGVVILQTPTNFPYGERQYSAQDLGGYQWTFSQTIVDLAPEDWGGTTSKIVK